MPWLIGIALAIGVSLFAHVAGFDREKGFYPLVLIIVGSLYVLFAVMAGGTGVPLEVLFFSGFAALAVMGFRTSLWVVAAGLALHGLFDFARAELLPGSGVPSYWPAFCGTYDVVAAGILTALIATRRAYSGPSPAQGPG